MAKNLTQCRTNSESAIFYKEMNKIFDQGMDQIMNAIEKNSERAQALLMVYKKAKELKSKVTSQFENNENLNVTLLIDNVQRELLTLNAPQNTASLANPATLFQFPTPIENNRVNHENNIVQQP